MRVVEGMRYLRELGYGESPHIITFELAQEPQD